MIFWYIGLTLWVIWYVFHDPSIDLRMAIIGVLIPNLISWKYLYTPLHSVVVIAALMGIVMLATMRRRALRRRLIFVVIGMFLSIAFSAAWSNSSVFWWPIVHDGYVSTLHPEQTEAGLVFQTLLGFALTVGFFLKFHLLEAGNWQYFLRSGRLPIDVGRPVTFGRKPRSTDVAADADEATTEEANNSNENN